MLISSLPATLANSLLLLLLPLPSLVARRQMLVDTIEPLRAELHKVEILKQGLLEQERRNTRG